MVQGAPRILMTVDAVGGVWQYATELASALRPLGFQTVLAVLGPAPAPEQRAAVERMRGVELIETGLPLDWLSDAAATRAAAAELGALASREQVDLVHLNSPALAAAQTWPVPVVGVAHGCLATWWDAARAGEPLDSAFAWHREMMEQGLRACDRIVAPSAAFAEVLRRVFTLPRTRRHRHEPGADRRPALGRGQEPAYARCGGGAAAVSLRGRGRSDGAAWRIG